MKVAIGSDHGGFDLKEVIKTHLISKGVEVIDCGCEKPERCDYPDFAKLVCDMVVSEAVNYGIVICGTGIGISIAANKVKGIRCGLCHDHFTAKLFRQHNNGNVLAMGCRTTGIEIAKDMVDTFLSTEFEGGRHSDRIKKIHALE
ncbi:putative multi-domain containing protein [Aduncisulcus paluster]|uniref:Multi-domain containing protein n=1 Tax=Aduncisulcus paluster TaxID=2918883 RepID=A0ABQ5KV78_9EUKA|nr:putative multi-domain containing protein [Aduncisulcus paluster]|eukprot:gnl/Carplike_NY0171/1118_a1519_1609.p1 GENE.gnl/Carplike_NY0171/1118_a1519_1609~~gnl/Carplike_NY0171/1118_a1519_1609.p1  ORF type:complete len:145 (-),score=33.50 gnl/Carplike_NY0171/1118_a1519_1609:24-458(-)